MSGNDALDALKAAGKTIEWQRKRLDEEQMELDRQEERLKRGFLLIEIAKMDTAKQDLFRQMYPAPGFDKWHQTTLKQCVDALPRGKLDHAVLQVKKTIEIELKFKENPHDCIIPAPPNPEQLDGVTVQADGSGTTVTERRFTDGTIITDTAHADGTVTTTSRTS